MTLQTTIIADEEAEQGARANAATCHAPCLRTGRATPRRGSSLTLGASAPFAQFIFFR